MPHRVKAGVALALVACAVVALAGCGGAPEGEVPSTAQRQAAGAIAGDTYSCKPRNPSFTQVAVIANRLPIPVALRASQYDCNDWDGTSTPGYAFTGKVLQPGDETRFTLQPVKYTTRNWTMEFVDPESDASLGTVRLTLPQTVGDSNVITVMGSAPANRPAGEEGPAQCRLSPMAPTDISATPWKYIPTLSQASLAVISRNGRVTLSSECSAIPGHGTLSG